jgi:hypothetical protein
VISSYFYQFIEDYNLSVAANLLPIDHYASFLALLSQKGASLLPKFLIYFIVNKYS